MIETLRSEATEVLTKFSSKMLKCMADGSGDHGALYNDLLRLHSLCGYIYQLYWYSGYFVGNRAVTMAEIQEVRSKIQYYNMSSYIDMNSIPDIGVVDPNKPGLPYDYRAGIDTATGTSKTVTFVWDGIAAPMSNNAYFLKVWVISNTGEKQVVFDSITKTVNGFTVNGILISGQLHYEAFEFSNDVNYYRTGTESSSPGTLSVAFSVGGDLSALATADYVLDVTNKGASGVQTQFTKITKTSEGFTVEGIIESGILTYKALIIT